MPRLEEILRRKVAAGIGCGVDLIAEKYAEHVSEVQEAGPPFRGPHSEPGEYPYRETGTGALNVSAGFSLDRLEGRAGVKEDGLHLYFLSRDHERLGVDDTMLDNLGAIRGVVRNCMENTP